MIRSMKKKEQEQERKTSFVRLTRLDGSPIWLNASFVVTIEPRKGGGSTVVPIGDGLDYDVRESPEAVLAYLDGAPVPEVVPVPTSDALTPTPEDVSPEDASAAEEPPAAPPPANSVARARPGRDLRAQPTVADLLDGEVARLRKMAPRTVKKLHNTIMTQFKSVNAEAAIATLATRGIIVIDGTRVYWQQPETAVQVDVSAPATEPPLPPEEVLPEPPAPEEPPPEESPVEEPPADEPPPEPPPADEPKAKKKAPVKRRKTAKSS